MSVGRIQFDGDLSVVGCSACLVVRSAEVFDGVGERLVHGGVVSEEVLRVQVGVVLHSLFHDFLSAEFSDSHFHGSERVSVVFLKIDSDVAGVHDDFSVLVGDHFFFFRKTEVLGDVELCEEVRSGSHLQFGVHDAAEIAGGSVGKHGIHDDGFCLDGEGFGFGFCGSVGHDFHANHGGVVIAGGAGECDGEEGEDFEERFHTVIPSSSVWMKELMF